MADVADLEEDVEQARERFAESLARVRSPATFEHFKEDLLSQARETKEELVERTREVAQDTITRFVDELKERAAANPAATLAIGAGLLWRLARHPPIASLLVGMGAYSLYRTPPGQGPGSQLPQRVQDAAQITGEKIREWGTQARAATEQTASQIRAATEQTTSQLSDTASELRDKASELRDKASELTRSVVADPAVRDKYLLGTAALAVGAALVIGLQRRAG